MTQNILLLEDLPEIRAWMKALVTRVFPKSRIHEAALVQDALGMTASIKFDLALLDLGLPDGSGVETRYVEEAVAAVLAGKLPDTTETAPVGCLIRSARRRTKQ